MQHHISSNGFGPFEWQVSITPHAFISHGSHVFKLSLSRNRENIVSLRFRQQLLSTSTETHKAAVTSVFMCCYTITAGVTSPLQSLVGFHGAQTMTAAADSPGYLWTRSNSSWDAEPPTSGGASQWEDFISGVKQIILTQSSHFASFFLRRLWS